MLLILERGKVAGINKQGRFIHKIQKKQILGKFMHQFIDL